jgi:hypothetical protein
MHKIDWSVLTALISLSFGWFLNEVGHWSRSRKGDLKIKKQILFNLLETHFLFTRFSTSEDKENFINKILTRIPREQRTEEVYNYLEKIYSEVVCKMIEDIALEGLKGIEIKYSSAVESLAAIDPITAYKLSGKSTIFQTLVDCINQGIKVALQLQPQQREEIIQGISKGMEFIKPGLVKEAINKLEDEILKIAYSIGIRTWWRTKKMINDSKTKADIYANAQFELLLEKVVPSLQAF